MKLFLTSSNNKVTNHFVSHLDTPPSEMRLTFIPTAAEVEIGDMQWLYNDRQALVDAGFTVTDFSLTNKSQEQVAAMLRETDFVFVSGGNTFFLLQEMKKSGFDSLLLPFLEKGGVYGGTSAGSVVAGTEIDPISLLDDKAAAPELTDTNGLGLIDATIFPHWGSDDFKRKYQAFFDKNYHLDEKIILLNDSQYLYVENGSYRVESV